MLVVNALGALLYLWMAHFSWAIPEERAAGIYTVTSEPFIWSLGVLPVWAVFLVLNAVWAVVIIRRKPRRGVLPFALVWVLWVVAFLIDRAHL
jgi:TRAP-type C4-dicarboxylate transport system permease small subunit